MSADWHYVRDGRPFGPFTADQLRQLAASGLLAPTDMVRCDADGQWVSAGTVPGWAFPPAPPAAASVAAAPPPATPAGPVPPAVAAAPPAGRSGVGTAAVWAATGTLALALAERLLLAAGVRVPRRPSRRPPW